MLGKELIAIFILWGCEMCAVFKEKHN